MPGIDPASTRIVVERANKSKASRDLWRGLIRFNRLEAGKLRYEHTVLTVRDSRRRLLGGLILQSYWEESYVELLWLDGRVRHAGLGAKLIAEAEKHARRRGSRLIHLNTYSFQAPGFYEKQGYRRFGTLSGSPKGKRRYFYVKKLGRQAKR